MTKHIADRDSLMRQCGNMLHPDAPKFKDEEHNRKIHPDIGPTGEANRKKYTHMDLIEMIDAVNFESGTVVSGNRVSVNAVNAVAPNPWSASTHLPPARPTLP